MYDDGPLSTKQQLDALKLARERAKLIADQAKAQQQVQKLAEVPPVRKGVPFKATALGPTQEQLAGEPFKQQASFKATALGPTQEQLAEEASRQQVPPTVQGVTDPFQQWKNATMGAESSYGNDPETWETNSSGARGLYQLTEATFNGLKRNGKIPEEYDFTNPVHNTEASEKLAEEVWNSKKVGQDPRKATAVWYSGPKAIDDNGNIKALTDPKNPSFPNTLEHIDKVERIRLGGQQVPPGLRLDDVDNDPRRTDVPPPVNQSIMDPRDAMAMQPPPIQQPTGREILIAKQDLANSTDRDVRAKAQAVLDRANGIQPPLVIPPRTIMDARDAMAMNPPPDSRKDVIDKISEWGEVTYRKETTEEAVEGINKKLSELDQNNPIDKYEGIALQKRKEDLLQQQAVRESSPSSEEPPKPEVKPEDLPDIQKNKFDQLGELGSQYEAEALKTSLMDTDFPGYTNDPQELKNLVDEGKEEEAKSKINPSFWSKLSESFGELFTDKEFIRFGILLAGGLLSGGSFGGSLKYAGLYALQSADRREAATAKAKAEAAKDSRERYQQLRTSVLKDMDTLSTQSRNKVTSLLNKASKAKSNAEGAAIMEQALAVMEKADTSSTKLKDPVAGYMYVPGRGQVAVTFRYNNGVPEIQTSPGVYAPIAPNARVESKADYNSEVSNLQKDIEAKVAPMLARLYDDEEFNSEQEARRLAVNIGLIRSELPEMSRPDFVRAAEMTIRSAVETSKRDGSEITEEGLRKALYGSSIIQLRRSNADMYTYKDSKGSRKPVDATYQSIIGRMYTEKRDSMIKDNPNYNLGMAAEDFENQYKNLPDKVKKPFESLGNEPDNKAPGYLHWLKSIS